MLRFWHLASFDAPTVAAVWSLAFAWIVRVRLPLWVLALQILVVWVVYVGDRLLDARAGLRRWSRHGLRERHNFHWRRRRLLIPLAVAAALASAFIALRWMPLRVTERDSVLGLASLAYFTRVHAGGVRHRRSRLFSKELLVGVLFTIGCALPAWSRSGLLPIAAPALFFAAVAWLNCRAIDRWEAEAPSGRTFRIAAPIAAAGAASALVLSAAQPRAAALVAAGAISALLLGLLDRAAPRLKPVTLRALADFVLLVPALLFLGGLPR
ncbi:MAG: hypothetical protein ACLGP3_03895 [Acidobacteriota bacterium]